MNRRTILTIGLFVVVLFNPGCERNGDQQPARARHTPASTGPASRPAGAEHPAAMALEAFNKRDWTHLLQTFSPEAELIVLDSTQDPIRGRQAIREYFNRLLFSFPDAHAQPVRILDGGGVWLLEVLLVGTQLGEFLGQPISQKRVGTQLAVYAWIEGGRIKKALLCANPLAILRQIQSGAGERRWLPPAALQHEVIVAAGAQQQQEAVRAFFRLFETADLAALSRHVTDDVVIHAHGDGNRLQGIEALRLTLIKEREAFDGQIALEDSVSVGAYVAAVVRINGTLKTDVGQLKATGKHFAERGIDIFRFEGNRIAEWDNYRNLLDLMRQLGIEPTRAPETP